MRPTVFAKFQTASIVIKAITRGLPERMESFLLPQSYVERRKPKRLKFFNKANLRIGKQALPNRCDDCLNDLPFDWTDGLTGEAIPTNLKKTF